MTRIGKGLAEILPTKRLLAYYIKAFIREKKFQSNLEKETEKRRAKFRMEEEAYECMVNESEGHLIMVKAELNNREHIEK
jgi:hypothetical protein